MATVKEDPHRQAGAMIVFIDLIPTVVFLICRHHSCLYPHSSLSPAQGLVENLTSGG